MKFKNTAFWLNHEDLTSPVDVQMLDGASMYSCQRAIFKTEKSWKFDVEIEGPGHWLFGWSLMSPVDM